MQALADEMVGQLERLLSTAGLSAKHCTALGCQYVEVLARYAVHSMASATVPTRLLASAGCSDAAAGQSVEHARQDRHVSPVHTLSTSTSVQCQPAAAYEANRQCSPQSDG